MLLTDSDLKGYTKFYGDSYEWRIDATRPATADEVCSADLECGCCYCEEDGVTVYEVSRPRYSKSSKGYVLSTDVFVECASCKGYFF